MFLSYPNKKSKQEILYFEKSNIKYPPGITS